VLVLYLVVVDAVGGFWWLVLLFCDCGGVCGVMWWVVMGAGGGVLFLGVLVKVLVFGLLMFLVVWFVLWSLFAGFWLGRFLRSVCGGW